MVYIYNVLNIFGNFNTPVQTLYKISIFGTLKLRKSSYTIAFLIVFCLKSTLTSCKSASYPVKSSCTTIL